MNARQLERKAMRILVKSNTFTTAKGKINTVEVTDKFILVTTEKSKAPNKIKRSMVRKAISFFQDAKTVTRKQLEKFSKFSSALLGLLKLVFEGKVRLQVSESGLIRLTIAGVRYVFAGVDKAVKDIEIAVQNGAEYFLMSYYYIREFHSWKKHVIRLGLKLILDSGAFTSWKKGVQLNVEEYANFIEEHKDVIHSFMNLDVVGNPEASKQNAEYLKSRGLRPVEVFHVGSDIAELDELVKGNHELIALGGSVGLSKQVRKESFDKIFTKYPNQNFHFLGGGDASLLSAYNWFSADSTSWIASRKYNVVTDAKGQWKAPELDRFECMARTVSYYVSLGKVA